MITRRTIQTVVECHLAAGLPPKALAGSITDEIMGLLSHHLHADGLIITDGGGPHLLDANDKTVWRADAVAGVAEKYDEDAPEAVRLITRRYGRRS